MLKTIQKKLLNSTYITNHPSDKATRYNITEYLKRLLITEDKNDILTAVDQFIDYYTSSENQPTVLHQGLVIKNKTAYFKKVIDRIIGELKVPDIQFQGDKPITSETIKETIIEIIEYYTTKHSLDFEPINPLKTGYALDSSIFDISESLFNKAYWTIITHEKYYSPLIEELLQLNDRPNDGKSIKKELDKIYEKLQGGPL